MTGRRFLCFLLLAALLLTPLQGLCSWQPTTLYAGCQGEEVRKMQQALIDLGYLGGTADGIFGNNTENAVRKFQRDNKLTADGLAGTKTLEFLYTKQAGKNAPAATAAPTAKPAAEPASPAGSSASFTSSSLFGGNYTTLRPGSSGTRVKTLQSALNTLGYSCGSVDGKFSDRTTAAVMAFQSANGLTADGLAGRKTLMALEKAVNKKSGNISAGSSASAAAPTVEATSTPANEPSVSSDSSSAGLFGGNYITLIPGSSGTRVRTLQSALNTLGYSCGSADGKFGARTTAAVMAFQSANGLTADGLAGKKTLTALEKAVAKKTGNTSAQTATPAAKSTAAPAAEVTPAPAQEPSASAEAGINPKISGPARSSVHLLHWFNDIKNKKAKSGQQILIWDPATGLSWTLRLMSLGRHADAEPLTAQDTATMVKAFGGNTWNQKPVYVRLPDGTWTIGSTHDMPHLSGSIKDNNFNGHLCVHFLRDMEECEKNDPKYGVSNQQTIRKFWKQISGEDITY